MSNPESFIDEVTEEVRRDRLYGLMRRWGWVAILAVLLIVGAAAWSEWTRSRAEARAEAFGDGLLTALQGEDIEARRAALAEVEGPEGDAAAILALLRAASLSSGEEAAPEEARADLLAVGETEGVSLVYRHLALLKAMLAGGTGDAARDAAILEDLATPGAPFRPMAVEQQALRAVAAGDTATAVTLLQALLQDADATQGLRQRAQQLIVALGADVEPA